MGLSASVDAGTSTLALVLAVASLRHRIRGSRVELRPLPGLALLRNKSCRPD
jgi:hypothetical protein